MGGGRVLYVPRPGRLLSPAAGPFWTASPCPRGKAMDSNHLSSPAAAAGRAGLGDGSQPRSPWPLPSLDAQDAQRSAPHRSPYRRDRPRPRPACCSFLLPAHRHRRRRSLRPRLPAPRRTGGPRCGRTSSARSIRRTPVRRAGGFQAPNRAHGFRTYYRPAGVADRSAPDRRRGGRGGVAILVAHHRLWTRGPAVQDRAVRSGAGAPRSRRSATTIEASPSGTRTRS